MKLHVFLEIGLANARQEDVLEIPDAELAGLSPEEREAVIEDLVRDWAFNFIDYGGYPVEEDEEAPNG